MRSIYHLRCLRVISPFMCALLLTGVLSMGSLWHTNLAHAEPATQKDVQTSEQIQQLKLDAAKESLQKDILAKNQQVDNLQKTIDQQNTRIGDVDKYLTLWGILITVLLVAFALLGFVSVRGMVQKQAKTWFDENAQNLKTQISELEKEVKQFAEQGKANIQEHKDAVEAEKNQALSKIQDNMRTLKETTTYTVNPLTDAEKSALKTAVQELKQKPELQYSFDDWNTRAFAAYNSTDYAAAVYYWQQATEVPHAGIENIARALYNKGVALSEQGLFIETIVTYDALIAAYSTRTEAGIVEQVAKAMLNKGYTLGQQDKPTEEIATYDILIAAYSHRTEAGIAEQVAKAMINKGLTLDQQGQPIEAIATYDALIDLYSHRTEASIAEPIANAMLNKGLTLDQQGQPTEAIATYDALIDLYNHRTEAEIAEPVAKAMVNKGITLGQQDKPTEEIATYDALIAAYSTRPEVGIVEQVANAFNGKSFTQLLSAKAVWNKPNERADLLAQAKINLEQAALRSPNNAMVLGNQAYVAWLLDDKAAAQAKFNEALRGQGGGEVIYQATLGDLDVHPIDADAGFGALIERLWQAYQATQNNPK